MLLSQSKKPGSLSLYPELLRVNSSETFGLVSSEHVLTFNGLLTIKDDGEIEDEALELPMNQVVSEDDVLRMLDIKSESLLVPEPNQASHTIVS